MIERLRHLPPRVRIRIQDLNPETDRQRIDPETGERLWTHEDVNAVMYAFGALYVVLYMLVFVLWDDLRAEVSPAYKRKRDQARTEFLDRARKRRERYRGNHDT